MTAKDLKKLSRRELIELLLKQTRELEQVKKQLAEKEEKLSDRDMHIRNAGSIAEAAIGLSGVFEAAQRAADEYLSQIKSIDPKELQQ
jgi:chromosome segregation and condensation protein ScpB